MSWFRGPYPEFVAHCRRNYGRGSEAKHLLWPARVAVNGARATAETNVAILVRQTIEGVAVDLTSHGRFLDRLEQRDGAWRIVERATLYEKDRLDPVEPSAAFDAMMAKSDAAKYPAPYRYMAYRVHAAGRALAEPVHYDGRPETEALKARYADVARRDVELRQNRPKGGGGSGKKNGGGKPRGSLSRSTNTCEPSGFRIQYPVRGSSR